MTADFPTSGRIADREHLLPIRVYYEDTDFTGAVYHGAHVRFLERGRSDFLRLAGVHHAELATAGFAFAVARLELDFKRPARIDDALVVKSRFLELRGPRLVVGQQILRGEALLVDAKVDAACIGLDGKPRRPPAAMIEALRRLIF
jgi:acyl-CoA thioester hydrolase